LAAGYCRALHCAALNVAAGAPWDALEWRPATPAVRAEITTWERAEGRDGGQTETALLPAPFWCTYRVEPAHFDWRWRERPALALLAWEA